MFFHHLLKCVKSPASQHFYDRGLFFELALGWIQIQEFTLVSYIAK
jgi:hypothetical protein